MGRAKRAWLFVSGLVVCAVALLLPYRPRLWFAKVLNFLANPPSQSIALLLQRQMKFWNRIVLSLVYWIGFPVAVVFFRLGGKKRLAPWSGAETYWVPRASPDSIESGIRDPF